MKKIHLSDGMPNVVIKEKMSERAVKLNEEIKKLCIESRLSYVEINKSLYLADKEIFEETINTCR